MRKLAIATSVFALIGCSDDPYDPSGPAVDPNAPRIHITTPARGTIIGDKQTVDVAGTASDDIGVTSVTVNGVTANLAADGSWTATVPVTAGTNLLHAIASDASGNLGKETRAVVAGPMATLAQDVPNAMTASLSAQTFDAIGRGTAGFLATSDLGALIAPHNPVYDAGGGPDCLYAMASITSVSLGGAQVTLLPQSGGLGIDVELDNVLIGMHLDYAAACLDGSRDVTAGASHIKIAGALQIGVVNHNFDVHFNNPNVTITNLDLELGGVPGAIVDLLSLDSAMSGIVGYAAEKFITPYIENTLSGLNNTKTVDVLGTPVDIQISPSDIAFDVSGAIVKLDTQLRAHGDSATPGFVFVANQVPAMDTSHGFELALADDAANQLVTSLWSAKGLDKTLDLTTGPYGDIGKLYDSVALQTMVPPYVDASNASALKLTIGDMMATFSLAGSPVTAVCINAEVDLKVTSDTAGLRLDVGMPTTYVDILDENIEGANQLSNAQFEAITSFALGRIIAYGSGAVGAVPLPSVGGVQMSNVAIGEQTGYVVVSGEVH
jgi:hypothetical protein